MPKKYNLVKASMKSFEDVPKEENLLIEFKDRVKRYLQRNCYRHSDHFLRKWLIARDWNLDLAVDMFVKSEEYRNRMGANNILETYQAPEVISKFLTGGIIGEDKEGSPLRIELFGHLDMRGLMYSCRKADLERAKIYECETVLKQWENQEKTLGHTVDGMTVIFDMAGVGTNVLWRPGLNMYLYMVKILEDNYPEMLKRLIVVNAPVIFPILWKLCRPLISEHMKKKIQVLGNDYKQELLKYVDENFLPQYLGGKRTDPDGNPNCVTLIGQGGQVPESYYIKELSSTSNLEVRTIASGEQHQVAFKVTSKNCVLQWEFKTDGFDIGFGLTYRPLATGQDSDQFIEIQTLIPVERVNSHMVPEDGNYICDKEGIYIVIFDNSFSWTRCKNLMYHIELIESDQHTLTEAQHLMNNKLT